MNKTTRWLIAIVLLSGAAIGFYFWQQRTVPAPQLLPPIEATIPPVAVVAENAPEAETKVDSVIRYPILETLVTPAEPQALPALAASDPTIWDALVALIGPTPLKQLFHSQEIVRHIVVTIDNLPRQTAAVRLHPTKPVEGKFLTAGPAESRFIAAENAARYAPYVRLAETTDAKKITALYVHFYPLFQRAYQELGYPNGYFNDRLVAVIDHLLGAPESAAPLALVQPHVLYQFANPALEAQSAGRKILLRMGSENASKIKTKLREIRAELIGGISNQPVNQPVN
ncbi:MAG: DUF3014 domain-containing protein [Glaciimonas sp.]|nr:DUF3014 domain-containing protein [Glaciimonas sp.]